MTVAGSSPRTYVRDTVLGIVFREPLHISGPLLFASAASLSSGAVRECANPLPPWERPLLGI